MGLRGRFPSNERVVRTVVRGPHPIAVADVAAIDRLYGLGMAGAAGGAVRIGEPSSPSRKYSGELGPLQSFRGALTSGTTNLRTAINQAQAYPSTHGPADPTSMVDMLGRAQQWR